MKGKLRFFCVYFFLTYINSIYPVYIKLLNDDNKEIEISGRKLNYFLQSKKMSRLIGKRKNKLSAIPFPFFKSADFNEENWYSILSLMKRRLELNTKGRKESEIIQSIFHRIQVGEKDLNYLTSTLNKLHFLEEKIVYQALFKQLKKWVKNFDGKQYLENPEETINNLKEVERYFDRRSLIYSNVGQVLLALIQKTLETKLSGYKIRLTKENDLIAITKNGFRTINFEKSTISDYVQVPDFPYSSTINGPYIFFLLENKKGNQYIQSFNIEKGIEIPREYCDKKNKVFSIFSCDNLWVEGREKDICLRELNNKSNPIKWKQSSNKNVLKVSIDRAKKRVAALLGNYGSGSNYVHIYDAKNGQLIWKKRFENYLKSMKFNRSGDVCAISTNNNIQIHESDTGKKIWERRFESVNSFAFVPQTNLFVVSTWAQPNTSYLKIYDWKNNKLLIKQPLRVICRIANFDCSLSSMQFDDEGNMYGAVNGLFFAFKTNFKKFVKMCQILRQKYSLRQVLFLKGFFNASSASLRNEQLKEDFQSLPKKLQKFFCSSDEFRKEASILISKN